MRYKLISLVFVFFFIASCTPDTETTNQYTGTQGVIFDFSQNTPPDRVYTGQEMYVAFDLHNRGAFSLDESYPGLITLSYDEFYFSSSEGINIGGEEVKQGYFIIDGKQTGLPSGGREFSQLGSLTTSDMPGERESATTNLRASICYPYTTFYSDQFCIDTNVFEESEDDVCRSGGRRSYGGGQGGPVSVHSVNPTMIPAGIEPGGETVIRTVIDEAGEFIGYEEGEVETEMFIVQPSFDIEVRNRGGGQAFYYGSDSRRAEDVSTEEACMGDDRDLNRVRIDAYLDNDRLECENDYLRLENGRAETRCYLPRNDLYASATSYLSNLNIDLVYFYSETRSKEVEIRRS